MRAPTLASLAQCGIRPQRASISSRPALRSVSGEHLVGRRDVEARRDLGRQLDVEALGQQLGIDGDGVAPAHAVIVPRAARAADASAPALAATTHAIASPSRASSPWLSTAAPTSAATAGCIESSTLNVRAGTRRRAYISIA